MNGRTRVGLTAALGFAAAIALPASGGALAGAGPVGAASAPHATAAVVPPAPLKPPVEGSIPVAFLLSDGAGVIDITGAWEGLPVTHGPGRPDAPFRPLTV